MGRISNAEKAEKAAALLGQKDEGAVTNTPGTNTHEGIKEQKSDADKGGEVDPGETKEITEINAVPGESKPASTENQSEDNTEDPGALNREIEGDSSDEEQPEPTATQQLLDQNPVFVKAGIIVGDSESVAGAKYKAYTESLITEETLSSSENLKAAGVSVGDDPQQVEEKLKAFEESQKPALITEADLENDNNLVLAGVVVGDNVEQSYKKIDDYNQKLIDEAEEAKKSNKGGEKLVYHGDHLSEELINQEGLKLTYDWDEVTAPEHLKLKPEVSE